MPLGRGLFVLVIVRGLLGGLPNERISMGTARLFCYALFYNMVNIGQNIKEELQRQERTVSWLARKLNCTRAFVYRIFEKNSIDTALLISISVILHRNFFRELSDEVENGLVE